MSLSPELRERIERLIQADPVLLFMKGSREAPQCGFSATIVQILDDLVPEYGTIDVLADPEIRDGIKEFSEWPTIPQLYVGGEFVGGCDIVTEMYKAGELHRVLGLAVPGPQPPQVTVTEAAAELLRQAMREQGAQSLQLHIDARHRSSLSLGPAAGDEIEIEASGLRLVMTRDTAVRADGATIDLERTDRGPQLTVHIPSQAATASPA
ncbi:MAG: Grx4 family monothiol glutaredoxin [Myxococcota bacterium]